MRGGRVGGQCMKGWTERLTKVSVLRDGETPLSVVLLLTQVEVVSQCWRLLDWPVWWSSRRVAGQDGLFCVTLSLDEEGTPCIAHWPCHTLPIGMGCTPVSIQWAVKYFTLPTGGCQSSRQLLPVKLSKSIVFPITSISIRRATFKAWALLSSEMWRLGKRRKDFFFFSFLALIASAGQKNLRQPFCSFQWSQLINS